MKSLYGWIEEKTEEYVQQAKTYVATAPRVDDSKPSELPERYRALAIHALQEGEVSLGRFAKLLGINRRDAQEYLSEGESSDAEIPTSVT